jgi:acylphosphatase
VQGVFFRSETSHEAKKRNVTGWISNMPDGKVEAVFEGEEENVKELVNFCQHGPLGAKVTNVHVAWENYRGEFKSFQIRSKYSF